MRINIGITAEARQKTADILAKLLADEYIVYTKTRNAHYNVEGIDFHSMHAYFEEQYSELIEHVDAIAERIRQIGHYAPSSLKDYLALTHLSESRDNRGNDSRSWMEDLLQDHESIIIYIRENIEVIEKLNDAGTADFLIALMEAHEKTAWMLRSHIK